MLLFERFHQICQAAAGTIGTGLRVTPYFRPTNTSNTTPVIDGDC